MNFFLMILILTKIFFLHELEDRLINSYTYTYIENSNRTYLEVRKLICRLSV